MATVFTAVLTSGAAAASHWAAASTTALTSDAAAPATTALPPPQGPTVSAASTTALPLSAVATPVATVFIVSTAASLIAATAAGSIAAPLTTTAAAGSTTAPSTADTAAGSTAAPFTAASAAGSTAAPLSAASAAGSTAAPRSIATAAGPTAAPSTADTAAGSTAAPLTAATAAGSTAAPRPTDTAAGSTAAPRPTATGAGSIAAPRPTDTSIVPRRTSHSIAHQAPNNTDLSTAATAVNATQPIDTAAASCLSANLARRASNSASYPRILATSMSTTCSSFISANAFASALRSLRASVCRPLRPILCHDRPTSASDRIPHSRHHWAAGPYGCDCAAPTLIATTRESDTGSLFRLAHWLYTVWINMRLFTIMAGGAFSRLFPSRTEIRAIIGPWVGRSGSSMVAELRLRVLLLVN